MQAMRRGHEAIDPITVGQKFPNQVADLHQWISETPTHENVSYYAKAIIEEAIKRELRNVAGDITQPSEDVTVQIDIARRTLGKLAERKTTGRIEYISHLALEYFNQLGKPRNYLTTPWKKLNAAINGFRPGGLYIIGARPGVGKTVVGLQIAYSLSKLGAVSFHSLEMSKNELLNRIYSQEGSVYIGNLDSGKLTKAEYERLAEARNEVEKSNLAIVDSGTQTLNDIRAHARTLQQNGGLTAIVIDYLGLITDSVPGRKRYELITEISIGLKALARDFNVPVIALAQLNRGIEHRSNAEPQLSDLRDSGSIEQDADVVILLRREQLETDRDFEASRMFIDVAKNRHGATGEFEVRFNAANARCENLD